MTCPSFEELLGGRSGAHADTCDECRAIVELTTGDQPLQCGLAEALMAAQIAGPLAPDSVQLLRGHLDHCPACALVAASLDAPVLADALAGATELERNFDELAVVASDTYVRGLEIGRGGMGHIVRARDRRLGRVVAIKELIDPRLHARFEHEARLTARLQHPAIVTVYEAGRWPNGEPFYAMKYVAGRPLDQVIADLVSLDDRLSLLANLTTVVEAIAYAHSERVVHRDLKPQNILLGAFGETVVIDWGLAKDLAAAEAGTPFRGEASGLTQGGAGTPAYMAPEQALGAPPDERIDVFALGATLHHVLAGDRPDLRPLPDATPPDLRAIVAKATAADPAARYPTAAELAGELRRFQNGQLVAAHRYTARQLVGRWIRRHRGMLAVTAIALIVLAASAVLGVKRIIAERDRADQQRVLAGSQRKGAERLVDYMLGTLHDRLEPIGKLELLAGVGKQVEGYFASVPEADETDVEVLRQRAAGLLVLGGVDRDKSSLADAQVEFQRALTLCQRRDALAPSRDAAACMAQALGQLGNIASKLGATSKAIAYLARERAELDAALTTYPGDPPLRKLRTEVQYYVGIEYQHQGDLAHAREAMLAGVPIGEGLAEDQPNDAGGLNKLAALHSELCHIENLDGRPDRALQQCERERVLRARQRVLEPNNQRWEVLEASAAVDIADARCLTGEWSAARATLDAVVPMLRARATDDPENDVRQELFAESELVACDVELAARGRPPDRQPCLDAAAGFERIARRNPGHATTAANNLASVEASLAAVQLARGELAAARTAAARAVQLATELSEPDDNSRELLSLTQWRRGLVARAAGRIAEARSAAVAARDAAAACTDSHGFEVELARLRASLLLAELAADATDRAAAITGLRQAIDGLERACARWPSVVELQARLAGADLALADLIADQGEVQASRARALSLLVPLDQRGALALEFRDLPARARRGR